MPKTLLWVDDEAEFVSDSIPLFKQHGFAVLMATSVTQALFLLREKESKLDGVIVDVRLAGDDDGRELVKDIHHRYPTLAVVVLTAYPRYDDHVDLERVADAYFSKPVFPDDQFFAALHDVFPKPSAASASRPSKGQPMLSPESSLWLKGLFFLLTFGIVVAGVAVLSHVMSAWLLPVAIGGSFLLFVTIAGYVLRTQKSGGLTERGFLSLMFEVIRQLPTVLTRKKDDHTRRKDEE
jgi:CheY-like chemotaxis protein